MRKLTEIHITKRDLETLQWLSKGLSNKEIGARMGIAEHSVKARLHTITRRLHLRTATVRSDHPRVLLAAAFTELSAEMPILRAA